jgi:hypothetical protein
MRCASRVCAWPMSGSDMLFGRRARLGGRCHTEHQLDFPPQQYLSPGQQPPPASSDALKLLKNMAFLKAWQGPHELCMPIHLADFPTAVPPVGSIGEFEVPGVKSRRNNVIQCDAAYVGRILKGERPPDLRTRSSHAVARQDRIGHQSQRRRQDAGLTLPRLTLGRAHEVG